MGDCIVLSAEPEGAGSDVGLFFLNHVLYENINKLELFSHSFLIRSTSMCEISSQLLQALTNVYKKKKRCRKLTAAAYFSVLIEMFQSCLSSCVYSLSAFCAFVFVFLVFFSSWFGSLGSELLSSNLGPGLHS